MLPLVVIDPGHGGAQKGAVGVCGLEEKDLSLELGFAVEELLLASGRASVLLTRRADMAMTLEERVRLANQARPDIFVSIHANASLFSSSRGVETFFVSRRAADQRILRLALVENDGVLVPEESDTLGSILHSMRLHAAHAESERLAALVQQSLAARLGALDRGVLQAPFVVLRGVDAPAVLVEVGFLSNEEECAALMRDEHRQRLAQALTAGILAHLWIVGDTSMASPPRGP